VHDFVSFSLGGGMTHASKYGGLWTILARVWVVLQGSGRSWWAPMLLGRALSLWRRSMLVRVVVAGS
jgi:hypothetical protein